MPLSDDSLENAHCAKMRWDAHDFCRPKGLVSRTGSDRPDVQPKMADDHPPETLKPPSRWMPTRTSPRHSYCTRKRPILGKKRCCPGHRPMRSYDGSLSPFRTVARQTKVLAAWNSSRSCSRGGARSGGDGGSSGAPGGGRVSELGAKLPQAPHGLATCSNKPDDASRTAPRLDEPGLPDAVRRRGRSVGSRRPLRHAGRRRAEEPRQRKPDGAR